VGDRSLTNLLAHELAHSWTGNLVTNATWEDFWLNEGWSTYAERRILGAIEGEDSAMLRAATGRNTMIRGLQRFGWQADPTRLKFPQAGIDPETVVSYIPYEKGYSFLVRLERAVGRPAFDRFVRGYIDDHRFQSITTEAFLDYLKAKLPKAARSVNLRLWVYEPGFPDDAPEFPSRLSDAVSDRLFDYQEGRFPSPADIAGWTTSQIYLFLQLLPRPMRAADVGALDALFDMPHNRIAVHQSQFFDIAIRSGYRQILPRVEALVGTVGRYFIVIPVFQALIETFWSRPMARALFEHYRERHHPITVSRIENLLKQAGI